tara:strand:- start:1458 stop:1607 length:150 start_codon:yes stop_codon:yes gene_type:complete
MNGGFRWRIHTLIPLPPGEVVFRWNILPFIQIAPEIAARFTGGDTGVEA